MDKQKAPTVTDHLKTAYEFTNRMVVRGEMVDILCVIRNELREAIRKSEAKETKE